MPRFARVVVPGCPHHVTQRGNNAQDVFFVEDDRRAYLGFLQGQSRRFGLTIEGYCLMGNHVHLVATPSRPDSLARAVGRTNWLYAQYVNRLHGRSGHLWQNRFYSCALDEGHFWAAMCYVERNPLGAGLIRVPWAYAWSSAAAHCGLGRPGGEGNTGRRKSGPSKTGAIKPGAGESGAGEIGAAGTSPGVGAEWLLDLSRWQEILGRRDWREFLGQGLTDRQLKDLRRCTLTGRPLGGDSFLSKLETALGRRLRPLPVGRPRKKKIEKSEKK